MKYLALLSLALATSVHGQLADGHHELLGPLYEGRVQSPELGDSGVRSTPSVLHRWNRIAIDASGLDHTPVAAGENRVFGEQLGPGRSSRAMAIVHIAIFDAANAIAGGYQSYTGLRAAPRGTSYAAAVSQAAHDTLTAVFPSQAASFATRLAEEMARIPNGRAKTDGLNLGRAAAAAILALRADDGSQHAESRVGIEYITSNLPGRWRQDPISQIPIALGAHWGAVAPFVLQAGNQFRVPAPPPLSSRAYATA